MAYLIIILYKASNRCWEAATHHSTLHIRFYRHLFPFEHRSLQQPFKMLFSSLLVTLTVVFPLLSSAVPVEERSDKITVFKPPKVKPFLHLNPRVNLPVNGSNIYTTTGQIPNLGGESLPQNPPNPVIEVPCLTHVITGNFTGAFSGTLVAIGAGKEYLAPESDGVKAVSVPHLTAVPPHTLLPSISWPALFTDIKRLPSSSKQTLSLSTQRRA